MQDYAKMYVSDERICVWFDNGSSKPFSVGEAMNAVREEAYMNGYNWDALFSYYLAKHAPELLEGLESDPEAGSYAAYYAPAPENEKKAEKFVEIITSLVENEAELCRIVREEGDAIEWD